MRAVFREIVDYAGLFPPAECTMAQAVREYAAYRRSDSRWMLGRFVIAAPRLMDLGASLDAEPVALDPADPWRLSVVLGTDVSEDLQRIHDFLGLWASRGITVDSIERKIASAAEVEQLSAQIAGAYEQFFEPPHAGPYTELISAMSRVGAYAKIRTGGTEPAAFPSAENLTAFLKAAIDHGVRFKATAGLHHPFRGEYPLTYKPGSARHAMYGFVNLLLAVTELFTSGDAITAREILQESDPSAFERSDNTFTWRGHRYTEAQLVEARQQAFVSFGSCSFREPVDELGLGVAA